MQYAPYVLPLYVGACVGCTIAAYAWRARQAPGARALAVGMLLSVVWQITYALEIPSADVGTKVLWYKLRLSVLPCFPLALLCMSIEHAGYGKWLTRRRLASLLAFPALSAGVALSMEYHTLLRYDFQVTTGGPIPVLLFRTGPFYPVWLFFCYAVVIATLTILAVSVRDAHLAYRRRTLLVVVSVLVPVASDVLFELGLTPVPGYRPTPSLIGITGLLLAWAVIGARMLDVLPIARSTVLESMDDLVVVLDEQERVVDMNPAAQKMIGIPPGRAIGRPAAEVLAEWPALHDCCRQTESGSDEISIDGKGGTQAYRVTVSPISARSGSRLGRLMVLHNITDLKQAREAAEAATRAKSAFLASLSHEIRTPMNVILGFTHLMARDPALPPTEREWAGLIHTSSEHLLELLNEALDLSQIEAGRMTAHPVTTDLQHLLTGIEQLFEPRAIEKGVSLRVERDPELPRHVQVDQNKLRRILMNLVSNAVKFTPSGSVILRGTPVRAPGTDAITHLRFTVADTGVGMARDELACLFEPFTQGAGGRALQEGTGLGLALSRQLARVMGGDIRVHSELGSGSTFEVEVRAQVTPEHGVEATVPPDRAAVGLAAGQVRRRILVVDDHAPNRRLLLSLLDRLNDPAQQDATLEVREAAGGPEALGIWESWRPHLIFMDMRLPGQSGLEVTREIRKGSGEHAQPVIVALSASVFEEEKGAFLASGCNAFVGKPYRVQEIHAALEQHLGLRLLYETDP